MKKIEKLNNWISDRFIARLERKLLKADTKELAVEVHGTKDIAIAISPFLNGQYAGDVRHPTGDLQYYSLSKSMLNILSEEEGIDCYIVSLNREIFSEKNVEVQVTHNLVGKRLNLSEAFPDRHEMQLFKIRRVKGKVLIDYSDDFIAAISNDKPDAISPKSFGDLMSDFKTEKSG